MLVRGWQGSEEEQARLRREEQMAANILLKPGRMLIPTRGGVASQYAADIVGRAFPEEMATTLLVVAASEGEIPDTTAVREALRRRSVERVDHTGDPTKSLITESMLGFDLVVSGIASAGRPAPGTIVGPVATAALMKSSLPVVLVRPPTGLAETATDATEAVRIRPLRRILLPVSASRHARAATELAMSLAIQSGAELLLLHVSSSAESGPMRRILRTTLRSYERTVGSFADPVGDRLMGQIEKAAETEGVECQRLMIAHGSRAEAIMDAARERTCDLVVLGAQVQDAGGTPYIGQTAETVVMDAPMTVTVIAFPPA
jgi:nucleotide-binding universal stress UspA family protein